MSGPKHLDAPVSGQNLNTIHVGMDISHSCLRYAIGRKSRNARKPIEILGINHVEYNGSSLLSTIESIKEASSNEFAVQIGVVDLCVDAHKLNTLMKKGAKEMFGKLGIGNYKIAGRGASLSGAMIADCPERILKTMSLSNIKVNKIEIAGQVASKAVLASGSIEDSLLFLDIRKTGCHVHVYGGHEVFRFFLPPGGGFSKLEAIGVTSALKVVKTLTSEYSIDGVVITGEVGDISGILSIAESIFLVPCRTGIPNLFVDSAKDIFGTSLDEFVALPEYSAVIGLLLMAVENE